MKKPSVLIADVRYQVAGRHPGDPARLVGSAEKAGSVPGWSQRFNELEPIVETARNYVRKNAENR
jgi:UDP-glucose 4-epimerase